MECFRRASCLYASEVLSECFYTRVLPEYFGLPLWSLLIRPWRSSEFFPECFRKKACMFCRTVKGSPPFDERSLLYAISRNQTRKYENLNYVRNTRRELRIRCVSCSTSAVLQKYSGGSAKLQTVLRKPPTCPASAETHATNEKTKAVVCVGTRHNSVHNASCPS